MSHPYRTIPPYQRWSKGVAEPAPADVDPVVSFPFRVTPQDAIVTAGSCFAQHIARYLAKSGYRYMVAERGHPGLHPSVREKNGYGLFSARYGNIYTARQLRQLFERTRGTFVPAEDVWTNRHGRYVDPFRPTVQPGGFHSVEELRADREVHFRALRRRAFANADVFIFTLGLTETWVSRADGAAYPLCPGVEGGEFDAAKHAFVNLSVDEVVADMTASIEYLRGYNPKTRVILTVSPVPLAATALDRHVLVSTTLSKSVLRVAADALAHTIPDVAYFPSFEIITGTYSRGVYFGPDLRSVTEAGVDHVMRLFFRHATTGRKEEPQAPARRTTPTFVDQMEAINEAICEEALLDH